MIEFRCSEQMKFYRRGSREVWSTKKLPVPRDQGGRCRQPPRSSSQCLKIGITLKDIEALPGLTKIETIDYHWLVSRAEPRDSREQTRLSQLAEKHRSALADSISVVAPESDTERVEKIGDMVIRYVDERAPAPGPSRSEKARRLIKVLLRLGG